MMGKQTIIAGGVFMKTEKLITLLLVISILLGAVSFPASAAEPKYSIALATASADGRAISLDKTEAEAGEEVTASFSTSRYRLRSMYYVNSNGDKTYLLAAPPWQDSFSVSFTMPASDISVYAELVPQSEYKQQVRMYVPLQEYFKLDKVYTKGNETVTIYVTPPEGKEVSNIRLETEQGGVYSSWYRIDCVPGQREFTITMPEDESIDVYFEATLSSLHTVTYKIENGVWADGTAEPVTERVFDGGTPANIPTGMKADYGYGVGRWDREPASATIKEDAEFTFAYGHYTITFDTCGVGTPPPPTESAWSGTSGNGDKDRDWYGTAVYKKATSGDDYYTQYETSLPGLGAAYWFLDPEDESTAVTPWVFMDGDVTLYCKWVRADKLVESVILNVFPKAGDTVPVQTYSAFDESASLAEYFVSLDNSDCEISSIEWERAETAEFVEGETYKVRICLSTEDTADTVFFKGNAFTEYGDDYMVSNPEVCYALSVNGKETEGAIESVFPMFTAIDLEYTVPHSLVKTEAKPAACETPGNIEYWTCSGCGKVFSDAEGKNEIAEGNTAVSALGHDWAAPTYAWSPDSESVKATRVCRNDSSHTESEWGEVSKAVLKEPTAAEEGEMLYTATFRNPSFTVQTKVVAIPRSAFTPCGESCPGSIFEDMPPKEHWAHDAIDWAVSLKMTSGTGPRTFSPEKPATRAQAVTFLWRAAGCPEPESGEAQFTDVSEEAYYYKAVLWAAQKGITRGTSSDRFSPDFACTRAQIATFLWRAAGEPAAPTDGLRFDDVQPGAYYEMPVIWAVNAGITKGTSQTAFSPDRVCTRAQIVTFLYRYWA